ncbi:MAG: DUF4197 family protein [Puniceicoccaceae bacterium]|nr:MAG: DUF4197 family protein [Puniceicoccaceae bacterium]
MREVVAGWEIEDAKALLTADGPAVTNRLKQSHGETIEAHLKAAVATVAEQMDLEERFGESLGGLASRLPTGRASAENLIAGQAVELFFDSLGAAEAAVRTNPDLQPRSLRRLLERL